MRSHSVYIVRGTKLQICHALLANPGAKIEGIKEIFSHEQAIGQCSSFLGNNPGITVTVCENTAVAARRVRESGRDDAASISSPECAGLYGLKTLIESVRNEDTNYTRFICISKKLQIFPGTTKLSFLTATEHRPGALIALLSRFAMLGVNISKLESRPIPGRDFEFMFYFDLDASAYSDDLIRLLGELKESPEIFSFLGAYSEV
jgi:chorismate mutase/prephenate dehydratase